MRPRRSSLLGLAAVMLALAISGLLLRPHSALAASSPTIISLTPSQGPSAGGTTVTLVGTDFQAGATVHIGGFLASAITHVSATQLMFSTPPAVNTTGGAANVLVQNPDGGAVLLNSGFFYTAFTNPLSITAIDANSGPNSGGTNVTITGTGFSTAVSVYFGEVPASVVNPLGSSAIFARAPANVSGPVTVTVTNPDGVKATKANGFTYTGGVVVSSLTPGGGPVAGGTMIIVNGNGFARGATLQVGSVMATNPLVVNSTQIVAAAPAGALGAARITVTNPNGQSGVRDQGFAYGPPAGAALPVLSGVSPNSGPSQGGTQVTLTGIAFSGGSTVYFGGILSPLVSWSGSSSMFARTPSNVTGPVSITVVNSDGGTMTMPNAFTYEGGAGSSVATVAPTSGPASTMVVLTGSGFNAGSWVTFDGIPALSTSVVGPSQIIATAPSGVSGTVTVAVHEVGRSTPTAAATRFTFTGTTTPPVTTPPVTTPPVTTPPASGGSGAFVGTPTFSVSGQALAIFGGGTADQLETAASGAHATGAWVQDGTGAYRLLVVGGPAFLKDQFRAQFPSGLSTNTAVTLTR